MLKILVSDSMDNLTKAINNMLCNKVVIKPAFINADGLFETHIECYSHIDEGITPSSIATLALLKRVLHII